MVSDSLVMLALRVQPSVAAKLDRIAAALTTRVPGSNLRRADALRAVLERGVEALEAELGITQEAPSKTASPGQKGAKPTARKPAKK
jgi:hypothetical protein